VIGYLEATGDEPFAHGIGLELLVATARLWASLGHHDAAGNFRIDGVTGPDEYSVIADNNVYTNLMAQQNLRGAAHDAAAHPERARELGVDEEEMARWRDAAAAMYLPYDENLGVHPQSEGFTAHQVWDFAAMTPEQYPLLHFPYFDLYRKQVVKQADLVLAMHRCPDAFTAEQKAANFAYYERLTVRDSSLSAGTQAVLAAETGHLGLAYDYLVEAALMDLDDLERNTRDGLHIAALAGSWIALVAGLAGMGQHKNTISFAPRLPPQLTRLGFTITLRGQRLGVAVTTAAVRTPCMRGRQCISPTTASPSPSRPRRRSWRRSPRRRPRQRPRPNHPGVNRPGRPGKSHSTAIAAITPPPTVPPATTPAATTKATTKASDDLRTMSCSVTTTVRQVWLYRPGGPAHRMAAACACDAVSPGGAGSAGLAGGRSHEVDLHRRLEPSDSSGDRTRASDD